MQKILLVAALLAPFALHAQAPAPTAAAAAPAVLAATETAPAHGCVVPAIPANLEKGLNKKESEAFNAANRDYKKCMNTYFGDRKLAVEQHNVNANVHKMAAEAAAKEFNGYVDSYTARINAAQKAQEAESE